jgi:hypothetical protein
MTHGSDQRNRLADHIKTMNQLFAENGQPEWAYHCEKCVHFYLDSNRNPTDDIPKCKLEYFNTPPQAKHY